MKNKSLRCKKDALGISSIPPPGWKDARWLGGYLTNSALMLGCAEMLVISVVMNNASAVAILRPALALLVVLDVAALCLLVLDLWGDASAHLFPP